MVLGCFGFTFHAKPSLKKISGKNFDFYPFLNDVLYFYLLLQAKTSQKGCNLAIVNDRKPIFSLKVAETLYLYLV